MDATDAATDGKHGEGAEHQQQAGEGRQGRRERGEGRQGEGESRGKNCPNSGLATTSSTTGMAEMSVLRKHWTSEELMPIARQIMRQLWKEGTLEKYLHCSMEWSKSCSERCEGSERCEWGGRGSESTVDLLRRRMLPQERRHASHPLRELLREAQNAGESNALQESHQQQNPQNHRGSRRRREEGRSRILAPMQ